MDEEQENLENQKKAEAGQKTAHVAGKAASAYFGGAAGAKAYDIASKTPVIKGLEKELGNRVAQNPMMSKAAEKLNDVGALDAADKGIDLAAGGTTPNGVSPTEGMANQTSLNNKLSDGIPVENNQSIKQKDSLNSDNNGKNENSQNNAVDNDDSDDSKQQGKLKKLLVIAGALTVMPTILVIVMVIAIIAAMYYPISAAMEYISGAWDSFVSLFSKSTAKVEEEYYKELKTTQEDIQKNYGICIDINLITATLTVNKTIDDMLDDGNKDIEDLDDINYTVNDDENNSSNTGDNKTKKTYKKMKKEVRLLANMQIKRNKYGLNKKQKEDTGYYCSSTATTTVVSADNSDDFDKTSFFWIKERAIDSSTPEKIASNDRTGILSFLSKKVNEETNYAYYLYQPAFDANGECSDSYAKDQLPQEKQEISIGDYQTSEDSVYYWNLVNSFIPEYYEEYLPAKSDPNYEKEVKKIADEIYMLYDTMGPSQTCASSYQGPSSLCPNGITVVGKDGNASTIDFEEYIAGVVSNEAYSSEGMEALKAQAVAARTYAINLTNYCEKTISNSTNAQTFTKDINDRAREAATSTAGEILVDSNGKIFGAQYDSFCYDDKDCPDAKKNADGTYSVTYTKVPNGEKHVITLSDPKQYGRITHGQGHAHGMSQLLSYQMAKEGKTYQEILSYFYSDGVTINLVLSPTTTEGGTIINKPIEHYLSAVGTNINNMNQTIYSQVRKAGVGTREGVVAAAVTLINNFYSQTGYLLPYELYPSGKYSGYGMDPSWGTNTGRSDYPSNGLDCSGFVSWAIHNGGFKYEVKSAKGWGDSSARRPWTKGMTDTSAKPGDLIYNAPQSANGTTGHIRMIVEVTKEGYVVAEASSRKNGVRIKTISFTSTGNYYLVNMDNYYASATKVTDYPQ